LELIADRVLAVADAERAELDHASTFDHHLVSAM
jgi:hypothetical protein